MTPADRQTNHRCKHAEVSKFDCPLVATLQIAALHLPKSDLQGYSPFLKLIIQNVIVPCREPIHRLHIYIKREASHLLRVLEEENQLLGSVCSKEILNQAELWESDGR